MIRSLTVGVGTEIDRLAHVNSQKVPLTVIRQFERVTGIAKTRRFSGTATELAVKTALAHKGFAGEFEDPFALIVVTQSPDRRSPCMAVDVHRALRLARTIPAFDVNQSCCGFIYGLALAKTLGVPVLLVCVDMLRATPDTIDELIFSDAACAAFVDPSIALHSPLFHTDGSGAEKLTSDEKGLLCMDGGAVFDFVTSHVPQLLRAYEDFSGSYDYLAQHQPNLSMMKIVEKKSGFTERSLHSIQEYGNQSMVSVATAIAMNEKEALGKRLLLAGYGAGWSAAVMGVRWSDTPVSRIVEIK